MCICKNTCNKLELHYMNCTRATCLKKNEKKKTSPYFF